ncbi:MAG: DMT family transporter [Actinomycetota bacterium]|nr:DMT family transporter [Actinomycetota bacterium]
MAERHVGQWQLARPSGPDLGLLAVAVIGVSMSAPLTALVAAPALGIAFWRNAVGAALLAPSAAIRLRRQPLSRRQFALCLLSGAFLAAHFAAWLPSITLTTVAASTALVCTTPMWTTLAARAAGHRVPARVWLGLALGLLGVVLVTGVDVTVSTRALSGDLLALLGGFLAAGYVLIGAAVREEVSTTAYAGVCYSTAAVLIAGAAWFAGVPLAGYAVRDWLLILAITICAQMLGHTIFNRVVSTVGPTVVGMAILLEVPGAALLAFVLIGQVPPLLVVPGLVLIVSGLAIVIRSGGDRVETGPAT